ncbi:hypothetical protein SAMN05216503_0084 [Polaribacter sp. KT25b]|uniref:hypothetical protein n=1 Tax=Polaribacter sp. KT25b TaxID=1855336 RepID=UPI00087CE756|nr:hypothetical protein [Polaribacter sp. KT25b]SDR65783.1 hypothetical protein SAMN05216503_0084 [Polaribacter sp. KT25b]
MSTQVYSIKHFNNTLDLFNAEKKLYSSKWFMEFGKFGSEVFNSEEKIIYYISKKFKFWKWKMVFTIKNNDKNLIELISQNNRKTIYSIDINELTYELKIHYKKKISIFKNGHKIAEIDESFLEPDFNEFIKLQLLDNKDLEISFLLFSCLKIGEVEQRTKTIITSQKQLEPNTEPWS